MIIDNTVYDNKNVGIDMENSVTVQRNRIFDNPYGLYMGYYASGDASGNLIYDNKLDGILVEEGYGGYSPRILNNTVYQPTAGNALRVQGNTKNLQVFNNIFWAGNGYALSVDPNSEVGFQSDYNLFYTPGSGKLGQWENRDFTNRVDWFYEVGLDQHSRVADPLFADPDGADNILGYSSGGLTASFYNNETFTGPPVLTRLDDHVDYNWGGSPAAGVNADNFSVRWDGYVYAPVAGSYTFYTTTDDGERLYLDSNPTAIIDQWTWDGGLENSATAGAYRRLARHPLRHARDH